LHGSHIAPQGIPAHGSHGGGQFGPVHAHTSVPGTQDPLPSHWYGPVPGSGTAQPVVVGSDGGHGLHIAPQGMPAQGPGGGQGGGVVTQYPSRSQ
jgi:hypothetical protein